jgi:hypothetical protein
MTALAERRRTSARQATHAVCCSERCFIRARAQARRCSGVRIAEHRVSSLEYRLLPSPPPDDLIGHGHLVRALDVLSPQVYGATRHPPAYLHPDVELLCGDVRDAG